MVNNYIVHVLSEITMANAQALKDSTGDFVTFGADQFSCEQAAVQKALQQRLGPNFIR